MRKTQLELAVVNKPSRGGKRRGAGRPARGPIASERHETRAFLDPRHPVHITIRVARDIRNLRRAKLYSAIRWATITAFARGRFRIVHASVQDTHIHLLVEAKDRTALARGMQGFEISAARRINNKLRRRGRVFADRYHAHILKTPRETRNALAYVLNNWRKHGTDRGAHWHIDPYSTGFQFGGWRELLNSPILFGSPKEWESLAVWLPTTWLLRRGWERHGLVRVRERPGSSPENTASRTNRGDTIAR